MLSYNEQIDYSIDNAIGDHVFTIWKSGFSTKCIQVARYIATQFVAAHFSCFVSKAAMVKQQLIVTLNWYYNYAYLCKIDIKLFDLLFCTFSYEVAIYLK